MPTATVHKQISERERIKYGTAQNPRGLILDIVEDHWPAGPSLTGIFSADGSQTFAEGNHPVAEARLLFFLRRLPLYPAELSSLLTPSQVKYVLKGELKVVIEGGEHVLVPGDLLSVPKVRRFSSSPLRFPRSIADA